VDMSQSVAYELFRIGTAGTHIRLRVRRVPPLPASRYKSPAHLTLDTEDGGTRITLRYEDWYRTTLRRAFEHKGLGDSPSRLVINA
jgi:hypothetical protein